MSRRDRARRDQEDDTGGSGLPLGGLLNEMYGGLPDDDYVQPSGAKEVVYLENENALVPQGNGFFHFRSIILTPTGLDIPDTISEDDWIDLGRVLKHAEDSIQWWIGDLCICGEKRFRRNSDQVAALFGYQPQTIRQYTSLANQFHQSTRVTGATPSHHRLVQAMEVSVRTPLLEEAAENGWSLRTFRDVLMERGFLDHVVKDEEDIFTDKLKTFRSSLVELSRSANPAFRRQMADQLREVLSELEKGVL